MRDLLSAVRRRLASLGELNVDATFERILINQGRLWTQMTNQVAHPKLSDYEFRVFSQWGEDGIIQFLISEVEIENRTFVEFGVEDFLESNCRFLMMNNNWSGLVLDGDSDNINKIKSSYFYWRFDLQAVEAFIDRDNINDLITSSGLHGDIGLLSVDIDGVDYWVLRAIDSVSPRIVIAETNPLFGPDRPISVPYDRGFRRGDAHFAQVYYGASLPAFIHWGEKAGYTFVGTTSIGSNAFFVRNDLMTDRLAEVAKTGGYTQSNVREGRARDGSLSLARGHERLRALEGMPVVDVVTGEMLSL